jgi:hypothetical protein
MRGESLMLPVMRKGKQKGSLQLTVTFTPAASNSGINSSSSLMPSQQQPAAVGAAVGSNGTGLLAGQHGSSGGHTSTVAAAGAYRPQTPDHPQQQDQQYQLPNSTSHQGSLCSPAHNQYTGSQ